MKRAEILVKGYVQRVAFRAYVKDQAKSLHLVGYVRNRPDGSVEVMAEGKQEDLEKFIQWAHKGSPAAKVNQVIEEFSEATGEFDDFKITY